MPKLTDPQRQLLDQIDKDPFSEFGQRDQWGRPIIDDKPHRRPSTMAGALDDKGGLIDWTAGRTAIGLTKDAFLLETVRSFADDGTKEAKAELRELTHRAAELGGSAEGRDYGSLIHALCEIGDRQPLPFRWPYNQALLDACMADETLAGIVANYKAKIAELGFEVIPDLVEVPLVSTYLGMAGTCDRIVRIPVGKSRVFDLKTFEDYIHPSSFLKWAMQLHIYASADYVFDPETGSQAPLPDDFDRTKGYICAIERNTMEVSVFEIDLSHGEALMQLAADVEGARKVAIQWSRKVVEPLPTITEESDLDILKARIGLLKDADDFNVGLEYAMAAFQEQSIAWPPAPEHYPLALAITDEALQRASVPVPLEVTEVQQRMANLPDDLAQGVEAHGKFVNRWIDGEAPTEAGRRQAAIDLDIAERAYRARKDIVHEAADRVPDKAAFAAWMAELNIDVSDPHSWTKRTVRSIDALSKWMEAPLEPDDVLKALKAKFGKDKKPVNDAARNAAKWVGVKSARSFDAVLARPDLLAFLLFEDESTP